MAGDEPAMSRTLELTKTPEQPPRGLFLQSSCDRRIAAVDYRTNIILLDWTPASVSIWTR